MTLLEKMNNIRKEKYTSLYDMSLDIGISYFTLWKFFNGRKIKKDMLNKIENFINPLN